MTIASTATPPGLEAPDSGCGVSLHGKPRILVIRGGALGDFILTLPSLKALIQAGYEVHLLTRPAYGRLAVHFNLAAGWRALDAPEAGFLTVQDAPCPDLSWQDWLSRFQLAVSWVPDPDGALQHQLAANGITLFHQGDWKCAGSGPAAWQLASAIQPLVPDPEVRDFCFGPWEPHDVPVPVAADLSTGTDSQPHAAVPEAVGSTGNPSAEAPDTRCFQPPQARSHATPHHPLPVRVALHPGSGSPRKNWPWPHWLALMQRLQEERPEIHWLIITGEAEHERLGIMAASLDLAGLPWESAAGLDLASLAAKLAQCTLFLGHDSGISHLAAACHVPCRLLFGPTSPAVWAPDAAWVDVLQAPDSALPQLEVDTVWEWFQRGLNASL